MAESKNVFTFNWKIENFSMLPYDFGEYIESSKFRVDFLKKPDCCFCLGFCLLPDRKSGEQISFYLFLRSFPEDLDLNLPFSLTLVSADPATDITRVAKMKGKNTSRIDEYYIKLYGIFFSQEDLYLPGDTLTVRCDIHPPHCLVESFVSNDIGIYFRNFMHNTCTSRTSITTYRRSVIWPVHLTKKCLEKHMTVKRNLVSSLENSPSLVVSLTLDGISGGEYIQIQIKPKYLPDSETFINCKMIVINANKIFQVSKESSHRFNLDHDDVWKFPAFIKASNLTPDKYLWQGDTLLLQCDFAFSYKNSICNVESNYMPFPFQIKKNSQTNELCSGIENLFQDEKYCDIKLETNGKTFPFYKIVLCTRSPVFSAMFENDFEEKSSNVIKIFDVDPDTLNRMLTFMCTDTIKDDLSPEDARELYVAADKYDVASLKNWCSGLLASSVSVNSVCRILLLADTYQDNILMTAVHNFIRHHIKETFHSEHWKMVMEDNPKLAMETMLMYL